MGTSEALCMREGGGREGGREGEREGGREGEREGRRDREREGGRKERGRGKDGEGEIFNGKR